MLLLHGGPGFDHSGLAHTLAPLSDVAQLVLLDHRGPGTERRGRSRRVEPRPLGAGHRRVLRGARARAADDPRAVVRRRRRARDRSALSRPAVEADRVEQPREVQPRPAVPDVRAARRAGGARGRRASLQRALGRVGGGVHARRAARLQPEADGPGRDRANATQARSRQPLLPQRVPRRPTCFPELPNIRCPTLVLGGELDPITPVADSEDIAAAIPQAEVRIFEGAGHGVFRDQPEEAIAVIREFVLR